MSNKAYNRMDRTDLVAACWDYIAQGTSGICLWQFIAGVLTVEWQNFEWRSYMGTTVPVFSVQLQVDTASGEVECRYAAMTGTLKVPRQQGAVCMMGGMTGSAYKIAFGTAAGLTGDLGEFLQWPTDQYIRFTPVAGAAPSLVVTLDHGAHPTPMPGDILEIKKGTTISSRNIDIAVSDTDMDAVSLEASLGDADGASTMVQSEFESASAATPYVIEPVSGEIHHETYCTITLIARDGTHACVLVFEIRGYTKKKKPEFEISPKTFNLGCATLSSASITGPGAILVLAGLLGLRRRRVRNS